MKTMIRIAAGILAASFVGGSTSCSSPPPPPPVEVHQVYHNYYRYYYRHHDYDQGKYSSSYHGRSYYNWKGSSAESFEPVEKF